jgi:parvulin-like peptidyl-prolyl isomerase
LRAAPRQRLGLLLLGVLLLALFAGFALAQGIGRDSVPKGDVALVEDVPGRAGEISEADLRAALARQAAQGGEKAAPRPGTERYEEQKGQALQGLIDAAWVQGEAAERGISVTPAEAKAELKKIKAEVFKTQAAFEAFLKSSHYTPAEVLEKARLQLLSSKLQAAVTEAVPAPPASQVAGYYEAAKSIQFTQPPRYDIRLILNTDKAKVERAKAALEADDSAATWKRLARRYSEDPTGKRQGGLHRSIPAEFGEPLNAAIAAAPVGELQGPVETKKVFFVFRVEKTTPEEAEPLGKVRSHIVAQLEKQNSEEAFEAFVADYTSKWASRTLCDSGYEIERCSGFSGGHPENAPPACYEAHPKAGIAATACPAPVAQPAPAMPGTVSVLSPKGTALPQRPQPPAPGTETSTHPTGGSR